MSSRATIVIRRGHEIVYIHDADLAREFLRTFGVGNQEFFVKGDMNAVRAADPMGTPVDSALGEYKEAASGRRVSRRRRWRRKRTLAAAATAADAGLVTELYVPSGGGGGTSDGVGGGASNGFPDEDVADVSRDGPGMYRIAPLPHTDSKPVGVLPDLSGTRGMPVGVLPDLSGTRGVSCVSFCCF